MGRWGDGEGRTSVVPVLPLVSADDCKVREAHVQTSDCVSARGSPHLSLHPAALHADELAGAGELGDPRRDGHLLAEQAPAARRGEREKLSHLSFVYGRPFNVSGTGSCKEEGCERRKHN